MVLHREPCPECGSRDNVAVYEDGGKHCFSVACGYHVNGDGVETVNNKKAIDFIPFKGECKSLKARRITEDTCRVFDYQVGRNESGELCQFINVRDIDGALIGQKIRFKGKRFKVNGKVPNNVLIGMHLFRHGAQKLIITEGEIDMLSWSQINDNKYPVVSIPNGAASAKTVIAECLPFLSRFKEILLAFDQDEPGQTAARECIAILGPKGKIIEHSLKDGNEMLLAGNVKEMISAIWNAQTYKPDGVFEGSEILNTTEPDIKTGRSTPFPSLTEAIYGFRQHEMFCWLAGTGCGKTDMFKELAAHDIKQGVKVGTLFLEEPNLNFTLSSVASKIDSTFYHVPGFNCDNKEKRKAREAVANNLVMYKAGGALEISETVEIIRYMVAAQGCRTIMFDHVTYVLDAAGESRGLEAAKQLMNQLNSLNKELPFTLHYVCHLRKSTLNRKDSDGATHEEGARIYLDDAAGGKALTQYADYVFALERNTQDSDNNNRTTFRILKGGRVGASSTGVTFTLDYDVKTGRKTEVIETFQDTPQADEIVDEF